MQYITHIWIDEIMQVVVALEKIKEPTRMAEGGPHLRKRPPTPTHAIFVKRYLKLLSGKWRRLLEYADELLTLPKGAKLNEISIKGLFCSDKHLKKSPKNGHHFDLEPMS